MQPIDILGFRNFRIFNDQDGFFENLSAINLLTGTNNSGKSSIIKGMQLLKNSVSGDVFPFEVDLTDQEHLLGSLENLLFNKENKEIVISLPFNFFGQRYTYIRLTYAVLSSDSYKGKLRKMEICDRENNDSLLFFEFTEATDLDKADDKEKYQKQMQEYEVQKDDPAITQKDFWKMYGIYSRPYEDPVVGFVHWSVNSEKLSTYLSEILEFYNLYLEENGNAKWLDWVDGIADKEDYCFIPSVVVNSFRSKPDIDKWQKFVDKLKEDDVKNGKLKIGDSDFEPPEVFYQRPEIEGVFYSSALEIIRDNLNWRDIDSSDENINKYNILEEAFKKGWDVLKHRILSINYLSTVREQHVRIYNASLNSPFINLLKAYVPLQSHPYNFVDKYLSAFEIGKKLEIEFRLDYQLIFVSVIDFNGDKRELVDYGYGIKQLVLLLIQISVLAEKNKRIVHDYGDHGEFYEDHFNPSLLLIEEPETNLHPKWQSLLAEMFYEANKNYNIQLVIETHSEYLIRKFQNLVATDSKSTDLIKIFYLRNIQSVRAGRKQVETMAIKSDGSINYEAFDSGFFDESNNLQLSLLNIRRDSFMVEFEDLKKNLEENEDKISILEEKIDEYASRTDIERYLQHVALIFDTSKLDYLTVDYLASGEYLLHNIKEGTDFSPVILQYGRAMENELKKLFRSVHATKNWTIGVMQGSLEKFKFGTSRIAGCCNASEFSILSTILTSMFHDPLALRIDLINELRAKRNDVAHPGLIMQKEDAEQYIEIMNQFLLAWSDNML
jgi:AAA15 family ATPase/GTPase